MANENDVWEFETADNTFLQVTYKEISFEFYTDCERWDEVKLRPEKVRELRDFLTAKLEGNDDASN